jgi:hypothetical protein
MCNLREEDGEKRGTIVQRRRGKEGENGSTNVQRGRGGGMERKKTFEKAEGEGVYIVFERAFRCQLVDGKFLESIIVYKTF